MPLSNSLVIDTAGGEQIVRRPRRTDAIGGTLRRAYGVAPPLPEDITRLLARLKRDRTGRG